MSSVLSINYTHNSLKGFCFIFDKHSSIYFQHFLWWDTKTLHTSAPAPAPLYGIYSLSWPPVKKFDLVPRSTRGRLSEQ